jgi:dTDP-glucose pyrophosphorylase
MNYKEISINYEASIIDALKLMDRTYKRLLLVFENEKFAGLLSIGDIQRAIIGNTPLESQIKNILRKDIKVAFVDDSFEDIKEIMHQYRCECMPVLDNEGNLHNVYFWEDVFEDKPTVNDGQLNLPVVIMAGGKGTRLKPITNILPKPLIPVGNKTILEEIMDRFVEAGCNKFFMSVNYKAEFIKYYFSALNDAPYHIEYFQEDKPLGTAGSMYLIKDKIDSPFFVSNCDIIINQDLREIYDFHKESNNLITIVSVLKHYKIPYGTLETGSNGTLLDITEKPELTFQINSGVYLLEPQLLERIPENEFYHITYLIEETIKSGNRVGVFPVSEGSWKDIGEWDEYMKNVEYRS